MWTALISGGLSLLSGFGARQSAAKQQKLQMAYEYQNRMNNLNTSKEILEKYDFKNIPRDAAAAGFNPVTYLGALGGSYGAMHQLGYSLQTSNMQAPTAQVPSMMEVVGNGLQAGFNTYLADARVQQSQNFQRELQMTQIRAIQANRGRPIASASAGGVATRSAPTPTYAASNTTFFGSGSIPYAISAGTIVGGNITAMPSSLVEYKPQEITPTQPGLKYMEPGSFPEVSMADTATGGYAPTSSQNAKDRNEEDIGAIIGWNLRNRVAPSLGIYEHGGLPAAGWGSRWEYSPFLQEYKRVFRQPWEINYPDPAQRRSLESPYRTGPEQGPYQDNFQRGLPMPGEPISGSMWPVLGLKPKPH